MASSSKSGGSSAAAAGELEDFWKTRFYGKELPNEGEVVVVRIKEVAVCGMGLIATMLEYGGTDAYMNIGDISKQTQTRPNPRLVRVGRMLFCKVIKIDKERGNTDISKIHVSVEEAAAKEEEFIRAKAVHSLMWHAARKNGIQVEDLCKKVSWPLFAKHRDVYGLMKRHLMQEVDLWEEVDFSKPGRNLSGKLASKLKADMEACLRKRLMQQRVELRARVEVSCSEMDGIEHVRQALRCGLKVSKPECELHIRLVASPIYAIQCTCLDRELGIAAIDQSMELIEESIRSNGGTFRLRGHPERPDEELVSDHQSDDDCLWEEDGEEQELVDEEVNGRDAAEQEAPTAASALAAVLSNS